MDALTKQLADSTFVATQRLVLAAGWVIEGQTRQDNLLTLTCGRWCAPTDGLRERETRTVTVTYGASVEEITDRVSQALGV